MRSELAGIQYLGIGGVTTACVEAVAQVLIAFDVSKVTLLSSLWPKEAGRTKGDHAFLFETERDDLVVVKSGFSSGYGGEGPGGLGRALRLLEVHGFEVDEVLVSGEMMMRVNRSALTLADLAFIDKARRLGGNIYGYAHGEYSRETREPLWSRLPPVMPFPLLDERLLDVATRFWKAPTDCLREAFVRLEEAVRSRTGLKEYGGNLFKAAFMPGNARLVWDGVPDQECAGRAALFDAVFRAHRNPRAHRSLDDSLAAQLSEFLLLNHLFLLEAASRRAE